MTFFSRHTLQFFIISVAASIILGGLSTIASAEVIQGSGPYKAPQGKEGFDRGKQSTMYCGNDPESWVRGSSSLDKASDNLTVLLELETDSIKAGPKGKMTATLLGANGPLYTVTYGEGAIPGKLPGGPRISDQSDNVAIPADVASATTSISVEAFCTGSLETAQSILDAIEGGHDHDNPGGRGGTRQAMQADTSGNSSPGPGLAEKVAPKRKINADPNVKHATVKVSKPHS